MALPEAVQEQVGQASGGFVSIVVLPRHVREATLDDLTWTLLTLHDHVQYHVKCFKVNRLAWHAWVRSFVYIVDAAWSCSWEGRGGVRGGWCMRGWKSVQEKERGMV